MGVSYLKILGERIMSETRIGNQHWRLYYTCVSRISPQICRTYKPRQFTTSSGSNSKPRVGLIGWYLEKLDSNPLTTKTITTSIIYAVADLSAQTISSPSSSSFDWIRTLRMAGYGFLILGPSQHLWFNYMSKILPQRDMVTTLKKIFLGQAIYGPANATVFFSYNAALQGESGDEIVARLKRDLLPTLKNGLMYWPICDFATYKFVPVHLQCMCISMDYILNIHGKLTKSRHQLVSFGFGILSSMDEVKTSQPDDLGSLHIDGSSFIPATGST